VKDTVAVPSAGLIAYLQLFRIPVLFTAISEVVAGFLFVNQSLTPTLVFVCLLTSTCLLYTAGMVLNDVFDIEVDRVDRPERPIPSGRVSLKTATILGFLFLILGVVAGSVSGFVGGADVEMPWRGLVVSIALAGMILAYDRVLKKTLLAPVAMGACRFLNVLLGMSAANLIWDDATFLIGYSPDQLIVASGIGFYIIGLTLFARTEAKVSNNAILTVALIMMLAGIVVIGLFPYQSNVHQLPDSVSFFWPFMIFVFMFSIGRRGYAAIADPSPYRVQVTVKQCLFSLVLFDATIVLVVMGEKWQYPLGVLLLALPMLYLGRWLKST